MSVVHESSPSKSSKETQRSVLESLTTKDPVVGVLVVVPGAAPGARVEDLVSEVLSADSESSSSSSSVYSIVPCEESCSLWLRSWKWKYMNIEEGFLVFIFVDQLGSET